MSDTNHIPSAISVSINLEKIDKAHIVQGEKGKYINVRLVNTPTSPYGHDYFVAQDIPKELREQGLRGPILGNGKAWGVGEGTQAQKESRPESVGSNDDLPF